MDELESQPPILLLDDSIPSVVHKTQKIKIIDLKLEIHKEIVTSKIGVKDCLASIADIVPMTRMLSVKINQAIHRHAINKRISIPCRQGCANCCHLLIILSVPEALCLAEELMLLPLSQYENLKKHWDSTSNHIREQFPRKLFPVNLNLNAYSDLKKFSNWYTKQRKPCAFLQDSICTIYEQRPLVCRDFMVMGSSLQCQLGKISTKAAIKTSLSLVHVLGQLASEFEHKSQRFIFLHDLFGWHAENLALNNRKWPVSMLVERFINILLHTQKPKLTNITHIITQQTPAAHKTNNFAPTTT